MSQNIANNHFSQQTNSSATQSPIPAIVGVGLVVVLMLSIMLCALFHQKRSRASTRDIEAGKGTPKDTISLQDLESAVPAQRYQNSKKYRREEILTPGQFDSSEVCAICLATLENQDEVRRLQCKHVYHQSCLDSWFKKQHYDCPICKSIYVVGKGNNQQVTASSVIK